LHFSDQIRSGFGLIYTVYFLVHSILGYVSSELTWLYVVPESEDPYIEPLLVEAKVLTSESFQCLREILITLAVSDFE
jgi:hypothetical protein